MFTHLTRLIVPPVVLSLVTLCTTLSTSVQAASTPLITEHVDLGVSYSNGQFEPHLHDEDNDIEYFDIGYGPSAPSTAAHLVALPDAQVTMSSNPLFAPIGASPGDTIWVLPQSQNPSLLYLGVSTEDLNASEWDVNPGPNNDFIRFQVTAVTALGGGPAPGHFSVYQTDSFGTPTFFVTTSDGLDATDVIPILVGSHLHYNWAFTEGGVYQVEWLITGTHVTDGLRTATFTTFFEVQPIPEPSTYALFGLGLTGAGLLLRRRQKVD